MDVFDSPYLKHIDVVPPSPSDRNFDPFVFPPGNSPFSTHSELAFDTDSYRFAESNPAADSRDYDPTDYDPPSNSSLLMFSESDYPSVPYRPFDYSSPSSNASALDDPPRSRASSVSSVNHYSPSPRLDVAHSFENMSFQSPRWGNEVLPPPSSANAAQKAPSPPRLVMPDAFHSQDPVPPTINAPDGDGGLNHAGPQLHIVPATPISGGAAAPAPNPFLRQGSSPAARLPSWGVAETRATGSEFTFPNMDGESVGPDANASGSSSLNDPSASRDKSNGGFLFANNQRTRSKSDTALEPPAWDGGFNPATVNMNDVLPGQNNFPGFSFGETHEDNNGLDRGVHSDGDEDTNGAGAGSGNRRANHYLGLPENGNAHVRRSRSAGGAGRPTHHRQSRSEDLRGAGSGIAGLDLQGSFTHGHGHHGHGHSHSISYAPSSGNSHINDNNDNNASTQAEFVFPASSTSPIPSPHLTPHTLPVSLTQQRGSPSPNSHTLTLPSVDSHHHLSPNQVPNHLSPHLSPHLLPNQDLHSQGGHEAGRGRGHYRRASSGSYRTTPYPVSPNASPRVRYEDLPPTGFEYDDPQVQGVLGLQQTRGRERLTYNGTYEDQQQQPQQRTRAFEFEDTLLPPPPVHGHRRHGSTGGGGGGVYDDGMNMNMNLIGQGANMGMNLMGMNSMNALNNNNGIGGLNVGFDEISLTGPGRGRGRNVISSPPLEPNQQGPDQHGNTPAPPDSDLHNNSSNQMMLNSVAKLNVTTGRTATASQQRRKQEAAFVCPVPGCGSTFTRSFNLKGHIRSHNEEKPFTCHWPGCGKGFARQHDCKRHEQLHTNYRPFTCEGCKKQFARMDALNRHLRSEGGADCLRMQEASGLLGIGMGMDMDMEGKGKKTKMEEPWAGVAL